MQRVYHPEAHSSRQVEARLAYCREGFLNTLHEAAGEVIQHADWLDELGRAAGECFDELAGQRVRLGFEQAEDQVEHDVVEREEIARVVEEVLHAGGDLGLVLDELGEGAQAGIVLRDADEAPALDEAAKLGPALDGERQSRARWAAARPTEIAIASAVAPTSLGLCGANPPMLQPLNDNCLPAEGAVTLQLGELHLAPDESSPSATTAT